LLPGPLHGYTEERVVNSIHFVDSVVMVVLCGHTILTCSLQSSVSLATTFRPRLQSVTKEGALTAKNRRSITARDLGIDDVGAFN